MVKREAGCGNLLTFSGPYRQESFHLYPAPFVPLSFTASGSRYTSFSPVIPLREAFGRRTGAETGAEWERMTGGGKVQEGLVCHVLVRSSGSCVTLSSPYVHSLLTSLTP